MIDTVNIGSEVRSNSSSETRKTFIKLQKEDEALINVWEQANKKEKAYEIQDDIPLHNDVVCGEPIKQVVLPACKRKEILQMVHEIPLAGHLAEQKKSSNALNIPFSGLRLKGTRRHIAKHANFVSYGEL
ncbi:retrovirus-related Pol polyprotein from transposon 297 [Trichonephila inaurata madagascariensis]|uniref:Retrovirus-related Pol polyprotein from transposon 297 n=1 Tax=Trichonephila inaurata madagascariensis TaxID=2747483 RepID=A0A8X6Y752_9ARAC|nr:retrovirus-related Pol polyprotein from transposon 297 [Trichonephila inaurata madagascariensis]